MRGMPWKVRGDSTVLKAGLHRRRTAKEVVFHILKERIMRQDLHDGDPLPEIAVARALGVAAPLSGRRSCSARRKAGWR